MHFLGKSGGLKKYVYFEIVLQINVAYPSYLAMKWIYYTENKGLFCDFFWPFV